jgi:hypothetical protein
MLQWALAVIGLTTIVTQSKLFAPLRRGFEYWTRSKSSQSLLHCPMCIGFWVGFGLSILGCTCCPAVSKPLWRWLLDGWASSGLNWIVYVCLVRLGCKDL